MKYLYEDKHYDYMWKCHTEGMTAGEVLKSWPFTDMIPTRSSMSKRYQNMIFHGVEKAKAGLCRNAGKSWTEQEKDDLILAWNLTDGNEPEMIKLFNDSGYERTPNAIISMLATLKANGRAGVPLQRGQDYTQYFYEAGFRIIGEPFGYAKQWFDVECLAFNHRTKKQVRYSAEMQKSNGCAECVKAGSKPLYMLQRSNEGLLSCTLYLIHFLTDGIAKIGITTNNLSKRGVGWPDFDIVKEVKTTLFHARRIESMALSNYDRTYYERIAGNGATECFEDCHLPDLIDMIDKEENLLLHEKNNT